jgi:hypothetical protein
VWVNPHATGPQDDPEGDRGVATTHRKEDAHGRRPIAMSVRGALAAYASVSLLG